MRKLIRILYLMSVLLSLFSCQKDGSLYISNSYPIHFVTQKSEIKDFTVYKGSPEGATESTSDYLPEEIWGNDRLHISPETITLCNDSILKLDYGEKHYKLKKDSIFIMNFDHSWSNIGYKKDNEIIYHIALIYIYRHPREGVQLLSVENSYEVFNYRTFFEMYSLSPSDFKLNTEKIAWCNIYTIYKYINKKYKF